eukprot:maker-scaffold3944_size7063-snap-gene-0.2 protein:Tk07039 transcript:maker-scaffold3944_size7063-snap-gene-0.2-mRNA-1 annotation:"aldehyde dehydrogenase"
MSNLDKFYIGGRWVAPTQAHFANVINPATEEAVAQVALGCAADVDAAVAAARQAFDSWSETSPEHRAELLEKLIAIYQSRYEDIAQAMTLEMGAPISFSREGQTPVGDGHMQATVDALRAHSFERPSPRGGSVLRDEAVGVCALITPWNWPMNQVIVKVAPALAAGCTMVLKPSEYSPISAVLLAEMIDEAGFPAGVFNLVNGDGAGVGAAMTAHPDVDMVSFTGSTRAGIMISQSAAKTVKRVALELGGKSPNVVFADADLKAAAEHSINNICNNSGQDCDALSRLLVERSAYEQVVAYAVAACNAKQVDDPNKEANDLTVRDQRVWLKTVSGLQRVDIILRFIDDRDADQLAYADSSSGTGIPGLLHAAIANNVQIINPLGVAALDNPALDAYMPALCQFYLGESLLLPSVATHWLGDPQSLDYVLQNLDSLNIRDINTPRSLRTMGELEEKDRESLLAKIKLSPQRFVATANIDREYVNSAVNHLPSRLPMTLRTYLANTGESFKAMPGGLCLLDSQTQDSDKLLDASKDVWVLSETKVRDDTLLPSELDTPLNYAMLEGELPSRVADNLFWFGRYAERLENSLRNLRSSLQIIRRDDPDMSGNKALSEALTTQLRATTIATGAMPGFVGQGAARRLMRPDTELHALLFDDERMGTLPSTLASLQFTAESVRDRISYDLLRVLNHVDDHALALQEENNDKQLIGRPAKLSRVIEHLNNLIDACAAISGMTHESFTHGDGWQFMMLGRRIERARLGTAVLGSVLLNNQSDPIVLENLLRNFDN